MEGQEAQFEADAVGVWQQMEGLELRGNILAGVGTGDTALR